MMLYNKRSPDGHCDIATNRVIEEVHSKKEGKKENDIYYTKSQLELFINPLFLTHVFSSSPCSFPLPLGNTSINLYSYKAKGSKVNGLK